MAASTLPGETGLAALAARFVEAERRVRDLLLRAVDGDRRALLENALRILYGLRLDLAHEVTVGLEHSYLVAVAAIYLLHGVKLPAVPPAGSGYHDLAGSLALQLDRSAQTAAQGARQVFGTVTRDNVEQAASDAVTALIDRAGARRTLGPHADMLTRTIGRHTTIRGAEAGITATDPSAATVTISGGDCPVCAPHQGTRPIGSARPPFHPGCDCIATPEGFDPGEHEAAMRQAARGESLRQWYVERYERQRAAAA